MKARKSRPTTTMTAKEEGERAWGRGILLRNSISRELLAFVVLFHSGSLPYARLFVNVKPFGASLRLFTAAREEEKYFWFRRLSTPENSKKKTIFGWNF
jgi:hypothetical protein